MTASILRTIGFRRQAGDVLTFTWGEISFNWGLALALCHFHRQWMVQIHLVYINIFIHLRRSITNAKDPLLDKWGFSLQGSELYLNWKDKTKVVWLPWMWERHRHEILREDGNWMPVNHSMDAYIERLKVPGGRHDLNVWRRTFHYIYKCRDGEVQDVKARVRLERAEWRWRWFPSVRLGRLPFPREVTRNLDIEFSAEVGEERGSYKGGCIGCSWKLLPDETPYDGLRRMERERRFD